MSTTLTAFPTTGLWAAWQAQVALGPETAAAWYQTQRPTDQATIQALTLAQTSTLLQLLGPPPQTPVEAQAVADRLLAWVQR